MTIWWELIEDTMTCSILHHVLTIVGILLIIECIISLELLELRVPAHVPLGTRAALSCRWQLGPSDVLYSVKWYKDGKEFFRYVPRDVEPRRKFLLPGVDVEEFDAAGSNITLQPAVLETGGRYRCEVSGERPLFPTVSDHADLTVIVLPDHGPVMTGFQARYKPGDGVHVNCTSGRSKPETRLVWYINSEPAPMSQVSPEVYEISEDGLVRTSVSLDFVVSDQHFGQNGLKVKCLATISPIYWRSNEESALKEKSIHDKYVRRYTELGTRADRQASSGMSRVTPATKVVLSVYCILCSALN